MIKVLHYGLDSKLGGIETYLYKLYTNINREKFQFDFLTIGNEEPCYYEEFKSMGSKFYSITPRNKNPLRNKQEITELLRSGDFDIIHCHLNSLSYITPVMEALKCDIPVIVHSRNAGVLKSGISNILHKINYFLLPRKKITMLSVSFLAGEWMFGKNADFMVINNGVDIEKYQYNKKGREKIRHELKLADEFVIAHVGAMREQKNHIFLLEIFKEVLKIKQNSKLVLVGDGRLKEQIIRKIKELNLENNVIILGNRNDVADIYSSADVFLFPSFYEGFPNVVIEAETSGLPCLISDTITKEVVINANCKQLSLQKAASDWAKHLFLLEEYKNREIAAENIDDKGFSVKDEINKIENVYKELILNV